MAIKTLLRIILKKYGAIPSEILLCIFYNWFYSKKVWLQKVDAKILSPVGRKFLTSAKNIVKSSEIASGPEKLLRNLLMLDSILHEIFVYRIK